MLGITVSHNNNCASTFILYWSSDVHMHMHSVYYIYRISVLKCCRSSTISVSHIVQDFFLLIHHIVTRWYADNGPLHISCGWKGCEIKFVFGDTLHTMFVAKRIRWNFTDDPPNSANNLNTSRAAAWRFTSASSSWKIAVCQATIRFYPRMMRNMNS